MIRDEWLIQFTDIKIPSEHTFEGKRYAGEVVLSHVLGVNKTDKEVRRIASSYMLPLNYRFLQCRKTMPLTIFQVGNVSWLLEEGDETEDWYDFLELYIRRWQHVARRVDEKCNGKRHLRSEKSPHRSLSQIPVDIDAEATKKPMQNITDKFSNLFEREFLFHPYDW